MKAYLKLIKQKKWKEAKALETPELLSQPVIVLDLEHHDEDHEGDNMHDLIRSGFSVNARNEKGQTALHVAPEPYYIEHLVEEGAQIDALDLEGQTPLIAHCKKLGTCKLKWEKEEELRWDEDEDVKPQSSDSLETFNIEELIKLGADVKIKDKSDKTAIHHLLDVIRDLYTRLEESYIKYDRLLEDWYTR